ncbi:MAG: hypothetical protein ACYCTB_08765 [bacterium]
MPIFANNPIQSITIDKIESYQLKSKRKLEILNLPKNKAKRESEILFKMLNAEITALLHVRISSRILYIYYVLIKHNKLLR